MSDQAAVPLPIVVNADGSTSGGGGGTLITPVNVGHGSVATGGATTEAIPIPAGAQAGDLALVFCLQLSPATTDVIPPAGWQGITTPQPHFQGGPNGISLYVFGKWLTAGDLGTSPVFTFQNAQSAIAFIRVYRGAGGWGVPSYRQNNQSTQPVALPFYKRSNSSLFVTFFGSDSQIFAPAISWATATGTTKDSLQSGYIGAAIADYAGSVDQAQGFTLNQLVYPTAALTLELVPVGA